MSNKELLKNTNRMKTVEWISPSSGAKLNVREPTVRQLNEIAKASEGSANMVEAGTAEARYVWTHLVTDPESGTLFTDAEFDELLAIKGLTELAGPKIEVMKMLGWQSPEVMQKN